MSQSLDRAEMLSRVRRACTDGTLRRLRKEAGLSLRDGARACRVDEGTYYRWETGKNAPTKTTGPDRLGEFLSRLSALVDEASDG